MGKYITPEEFVEHMELEPLNETDQPKLSTVKKWIERAEKEIDDTTKQRWEKHTVENELISPVSLTDTHFVSVRPLIRILSLEYNAGDEWTPDYTSIDPTEFRIERASNGKFQTKNTFGGKEKLRISYEAGNDQPPEWLKELALYLTEKRYLMSRLGISAADTETVSIAVIRLKDKSLSSMKYRAEFLDKEIREAFGRLGKSMKAMNYNFSDAIRKDNITARDRQHGWRF